MSDEMIETFYILNRSIDQCDNVQLFCKMLPSRETVKDT